MVKVTKHEHEDFDALFSRFKRNVQRSNILYEVRRREYYLKPGVKKREKIKENRRKNKSGY